MSESSMRLRGMILTLTERCNLRCDYCYVPVERGRTMSPQTADRAVDLFVGSVAAEGALNLSFFGGEPFLAGQEMRRIVERVRSEVGRGRNLRVVTPTNALALSSDDLAWCRREGIELAVSVDGGPETVGRNHANGQSCAGEVVDASPELLRQLPPGAVMARMTVTPTNVGSLCSNIRTLARLGFQRIVYLPDYLAGWSEAALALWRREHQRIATWLVGAKAAGKKVPDLPAWRAIETRLLRAAPRSRCGAGIDQVTVTPDGEIFPCYRFGYAANAEAWRLGNVQDGFVEPQRLAKLRGLDAQHLRPERGNCANCSVSDGCTHYCPALGFLAGGDIASVPEVACQLMQAQVECVRGLCSHTRRASRAKTASPGWAAAAVMAAAITAGAACGKAGLNAPPKGGNPDANDANFTRDIGMGGGICAVQLNPDMAPDIEPFSGSDAGDTGNLALDADNQDTLSPYGGGICPVAAPDIPPLPVGGIC